MALEIIQKLLIMNFLFQKHSPIPQHVCVWMSFAGPTIGTVILFFLMVVTGLLWHPTSTDQVLSFATLFGMVLIGGNIVGFIPAAGSSIVTIALLHFAGRLSILAVGVIGSLTTMLYMHFGVEEGETLNFSRYGQDGILLTFLISCVGAVAAAVTYALAIWTTNRKKSEDSISNSP